jgi:pilus assembly protein CpaB
MLRRLPYLLLALLISGVTVLLVQQWLHGRLSHAPGAAVGDGSTSAFVKVLVAKGNLQLGSLVRPDGVRWQTWPKADLDVTYLTDAKAKVTDLVGAVVRQPLASGEPITAAKVVQPGERGFLAAVLAPGKRAVTINVTTATGMAGFALPGDHVDLILTMVIQPREKDGPTRYLSETVLGDLRVLGMDQKFVDDKKDPVAPKTASLEVTPKQAEVVAVASEMGLLSLTLRGLANTEGDDTSSPVTQTWDVEATKLAVAQPLLSTGLARRGRTQRTIVVVRGVALSTVELPSAAPSRSSQRPPETP